MSSGKPQTRGLAALLRLEKERREREEAESARATAEPPEGEQDQPASPRATPYAVASKPAAGAGEAAEPVNQLSAPQAQPAEDSLLPSDTSHASDSRAVVSAAPASGTQPHAGGERAAAASDSLPRPATVRPLRATRKRVEAPSESAPVVDPGWDKFVADWKPFLREGVKFKLCEFFYRNTVALGKREFITSTAQLSRVSSAHRRHIFLVLRQLEDLRFIRKESVETNRKDEGLVIRFYPDRQA